MEVFFPFLRDAIHFKFIGKYLNQVLKHLISFSSGATYATMVLWGYGGNILMQAFHATFGIGKYMNNFCKSILIHSKQMSILVLLIILN